MIKIYKTQSEVDADIKDGVLVVDSDVRFEFSLKVDARLEIKGNINAWNITAWNIIASDITAEDISFYAVCFAYNSFVCNSIKGRRLNSKYFCLDKKVEIKNAK